MGLFADLHELVSTQCINCNQAYLLVIQQNGNVAELRSLVTRDTFHQPSQV